MGETATIPLTHDGETDPRWAALERCCFCSRRTSFWYAPKDVPVCEECAEVRTVDEVPTKAEWWPITADEHQAAGRAGREG